MNNVALALRVPLLFVLTTDRRQLLLSNLISLVALTVIRFGVSDAWIWAAARSDDRTPHCYDIHGIVTVASEVRLPELERFETGELVANPTLRVTIGRVPRSDGGLNGARPDPVLTPSLNGHGPSLNGNSSNGTHPIRYRESLGGLGFAVEIKPGIRSKWWRTPLLRWSPHVLYHQRRRADPALDCS